MSEAFAAFQRLLPTHRLSRLVGAIAASETPWVKNTFIQWFARAYDITLEEAQRTDFADYTSFNDFFTRALKHDARPVDPDPAAVISPADGTISQAGQLNEDRLLQAKGTQYRLGSLAGEMLPEYANGCFCTVYLAPNNYHRVHLPVSGKLIRTTAIPGELFSVNARTEAAISDLFCRNERLVCHYETDHGPMLVIMVGALIVASIKTAWDGPDSPYHETIRTDYRLKQSKGAEMGQFLLGSTVIVCFAAGAVSLDEQLVPGRQIQMGERIGTLSQTPAEPETP